MEIVTKNEYCECGETLPEAKGILNTIKDWMDKNAFIPQQELTFSASLILLGTLISRKFSFQGMSSNLYIINIAPSGSGKDNCQQRLKEALSDCGADFLLGAGDYVSDASLMDSLPVKPVRLDIMDECGGILKSVNKGKSEYNSKMADVLAELYTSSTSKYLGRALAEGTKGACYRPNVSILGSTTPAGFSEGVSRRSIEKGLLGRMLIFRGSGNTAAKRIKKFTKLDVDTLTRLRWFVGYVPKSDDVTEPVTEIGATDEANKRLDSIFIEFDELRRSLHHSNTVLPIVARLYQQMIKVVMIHAASRASHKVPVVDIMDVEFGYETIKYYYETIKDVVQRYVPDGTASDSFNRIVGIIRDSVSISKTDFTKSTRFVNKRERDSVLADLAETGEIVVTVENRKTMIYWVGDKDE